MKKNKIFISILIIIFLIIPSINYVKDIFTSWGQSFVTLKLYSAISLTQKIEEVIDLYININGKIPSEKDLNSYINENINIFNTNNLNEYYIKTLPKKIKEYLNSVYLVENSNKKVQIIKLKKELNLNEKYKFDSPTLGYYIEEKNSIFYVKLYYITWNNYSNFEKYFCYFQRYYYNTATDCTKYHKNLENGRIISNRSFPTGKDNVKK